MEFIIIRHGQTPGNAEKRYVGVLDQPLSNAGRAEAFAAGACPDIESVYVTTLRRTHETASIMFPNAKQTIVEGIQEMNFGVFADRTPDEMREDADYRNWVDSGCTLACPEGESQLEFTNRVCEALEALLRASFTRGEERVVLVAHGGTMMAALSRFADDGRAYWDWLVGNCEGYRIQVDFPDGVMRFSDVEKLDLQSL